jgi:hypothetical protein
MRPMRATALTILIALGTICTSGQQPWQKIQMPGRNKVARLWLNPPPEYGPEPYYSLDGRLDKTVVSRDLDRIKALGFRAVTVQAGRGMPFRYLSDEYLQFFRLFVEAAKERGLCVWIVDDAGYPSGFAGGEFTELKPELRMQALVVGDTIPASGGEVIRRLVGAETVGAIAASSDHQAGVAVPVRAGTIDWRAPAGKWEIFVIQHQFRTSPTRSETNPTRAKDTSQSLEDYLNPEATAQFIAFTHDRYKQVVGDEFGRTILGFRGDEPDYSIRGLPWTPAFFDRFEAIKGYDIRPYVPWFFLTDLTDEEKRAKADYWDVFSQMFRDGFFKVLGNWCAANHLEYQVHLNHEEAEMQLARSEGGFFRDMRYMQVPGIDAIWHQIWTDTISDYPRLASSAAHLFGRPRAFTESFAAYRPTPDLAQARYILNEQFVRGINLVEVMYLPSSGNGPRPLRGVMADPRFPALMGYTRRLSFLMEMGKPAARVGLYIPTSSFWLGDNDANEAFVSAERLLSEHQVDFDIVDDDALAGGLISGRGTFETRSGNRFRTVIVPDALILSQKAVDRLRAFASGGGHVLFLGHVPQMVCGRTILHARSSDPSEFWWASVAKGQLPPTPTPPMQPPSSPPAPQVVPRGILKAVAQAIPTTDFSLDAPSTALRYSKRRLKDATVFLFFNEAGEPLQRTLRLTNPGHRAERWDPKTGQIEALASGGILNLSLQPYETEVVVVQ